MAKNIIEILIGSMLRVGMRIDANDVSKMSFIAATTICGIVWLYVELNKFFVATNNQHRNNF